MIGRVEPWPLHHEKALNPDWCEWYMGLPDGWTDCGVARTRRISMLGNVAMPQQAFVAFRLLVDRIADAR